MSDAVIEIEGLSKRYQLGALPSAGSMLRRLIGIGAGRAAQPTEFWALRDVTLNVHRGEVLGLIGRNGAGKSTLLKILSRITEPTAGQARIRGRVGSLLEVGTGFHPELTGRENIYLNGAILGMRHSEIRAKFDQIIAFAEIEKFLDTPVKRYSSGMYVRLAFAVAAHLEPEVLLVDEVLAVGDASFQKKCLGKMQDVAGRGRTVIFVSHNLKAVRSLCDRVAWLDDGRLRMLDATEAVTGPYLHAAEPVGGLEQLPRRIAALPPDPDFRLLDVRIEQAGRATTAPGSDQPVDVSLHYEVRRRIEGLRVYFDLCDEYGDILIRSFNDETAQDMSIVEPGRYTASATMPAELLAPRDYTLVMRATIFNLRQLTGDGVPIRLSVKHTSNLNLAYAQDPIRSKLQPRIPWQTRKVA